MALRTGKMEAERELMRLRRLAMRRTTRMTLNARNMRSALIPDAVSSSSDSSEASTTWVDGSEDARQCEGESPERGSPPS
eukprot:2370402-Rhodomonas_salina.3